MKFIFEKNKNFMLLKRMFLLLNEKNNFIKDF
jgi:hypothetical protein